MALEATIEEVDVHTPSLHDLVPLSIRHLHPNTYSISIVSLHGSIGFNCIGIAMNPKQKTAIIVVALVLVPIVLLCCAFALALGCAEFWSSGRFTLVKPWIKRQLAAVRKGLKPINPDNPRPSIHINGRNNISSNTQTAMPMAEV
ncbi:hypothetical protein BJX76DRAFT_45510 [Aspergillus varians]